MLDRMMRLQPNLASEPVALGDAVNALPREWRETWARSYQDASDGLTPVLTAIRRSLETDGKKAWVAAYKKTTGVDARRALSPLDLATQMYRECLLLRLMKDSLTELASERS